MRRTLSALLLGGVATAPALAMDLSLAGSWSLPVTASALVAGAGGPLQPRFDSGAGEVTVEVSLTAGDTDAWRLEVRRSDASWDDSLRVWVRRTGDGSGTGSIAGGLAWVEVGPTNSVFFDGAGDRDAIPLQLRVDGLSLGVRPDVYLSALQYTLVDSL